MFYKSKYFAPSERKPIRLGCMMMRLTAVLVCLVLVSFHLMTGLYARYSSTATGSDSARVAKFDVDVVYKNGDDAVNGITADLQYNEDAGNYTITVINNSEVTISYNIRIENIGLVTTKKNGEAIVTIATAETHGVSAKLITAGQGEKSFKLIEGTTSVDFGSMGVLTPGSSQQTHTLSFPIEWETYTQSVEGDNISVTITFKVVVDVTQVD